jgi:probable phosphoglycerate mutase
MEQTNKWLYIIRHGETDFNKNKVIQGSGVDSSLNDTGISQASKFYNAYSEVKFELVVCSKLKRSFQTIEPFLSHDIPLERYAEINEINWGIHEGQKSTPALIEDYKKVVSEWENGNFNASVTNGESATSLSTRLKHFLDLIRGKKEKKILICSHGRTLRCLMCLINQESIGKMEKYRHSNTGLFLVHQTEGQFVLVKNNNTTHLNGSLKV